MNLGLRNVQKLRRGTKLNRHFIVRIDNGVTPPKVGSIASSHRTLAGGPMVDADGYLLLEVNGQKRLSLRRLRALSGKPGHWDDVGGAI